MKKPQPPNPNFVPSMPFSEFASEIPIEPIRLNSKIIIDLTDDLNIDDSQPVKEPEVNIDDDRHSDNNEVDLDFVPPMPKRTRLIRTSLRQGPQLRPRKV